MGPLAGVPSGSVGVGRRHTWDPRRTTNDQRHLAEGPRYPTYMGPKPRRPDADGSQAHPKTPIAKRDQNKTHRPSLPANGTHKLTRPVHGLRVVLRQGSSWTGTGKFGRLEPPPAVGEDVPPATGDWSSQVPLPVHCFTVLVVQVKLNAKRSLRLSRTTAGTQRFSILGKKIHIFIEGYIK